MKMNPKSSAESARNPGNVMSLGYGIVEKKVLCSTEIEWQAKSIYVYLCGYADSSGTAYPSLGRILSELDICKNTYYKFIRQLEDAGFISICHEKQSGRFKRTVFSLRHGAARPESGYGFIPKKIVASDLSCESKVVYGYFAAFAGVEDTVCPAQKHICYHLGISAYKLQKALRELVAQGYIAVSQRHNGRFGKNEITLLHQQVIPDRIGVGKKRYNETLVPVTPDNPKAYTIPGQDTKICDTVKQDSAEQETTGCTPNNISCHTKTAFSRDRKNTNRGAHTRRAGNRRPSVSKAEYSVKDETEAFRQISQNRCIPAAWLDNKKLCNASIDYLLEYKQLNNAEGWGNKAALAMYQNFVAGLKSLLTTDESVLNGEYVTPDYVLEKINSFLAAGSDVSLWDVQSIAENYYLDSASKFDIRNPAAYMRSCIWTAMNNASSELERLYSA